MDQNSQNRRPNAHSHRNRRGNERRRDDRRPQPPQNQERPGRSNATDVEQIMRDLRARIAQRHGIDLSQQQLQELAARRLEAILDPRTVKPALLEELRRGAAAAPEAPATGAPGYDFTDTTIYESHRGFIRFMRRLLNPVLMLFVNPNPIARALSAQSRINTEAAERATEQAQRQTEWNALHFDILQRLVTEVAKVSIEVQALSSRVESLVARVDFNDKRVRTLENAPATGGRPSHRPVEPAVAQAPQTAAATVPGGSESGVTESGGEGVRRKRRRRRGRRSGTWSDAPGQPGVAEASGQESSDDVDRDDDGPEGADGSDEIADAEDSPRNISNVTAATSDDGSAPRAVPASPDTADAQPDRPASDLASPVTPTEPPPLDR